MNYGAWAERRNQQDDRLREMEETATDLRRLVQSDTGEHLKLSDIHRTQEKFAGQVMQMFRTAEKDQAKERYDMGRELASLNAKMTIVLWLCGTCLGALIVGVAGLMFGLLGAKGHLG